MAQRRARRKDRKPPTEAMRKKALYDYWTFIDCLSFHGGSKAFYSCHRDMEAWAHRPDASLKQLVLMPRGHLKSTVLSVGETLWDIYRNPNIRIFVGTATRALATAFVREIKSYLEDPFLQEHLWHVRPHIEGRLVPTMDKVGKQRRLERDDTEAEDKKVVWRNDAIQVIRTEILKEPTVMAGSVGSTATGFHYDKLVLDDVVTFDNCNTPTKHDRLFGWIYDLESVLDPPYEDEDHKDFLFSVIKNPGARRKLRNAYELGGQVRVIGTLYEKDDYYQHILKHVTELGFEVYQKNIYVNGKNNLDGYIWKEKFSEKYEKQLRVSMTARRFYSQYLNEILNPEDVVLDWEKVQWLSEKDWVRHEDKVGIVEILAEPHNKLTKEPIFIRPVLVVDPAATANKTSDYTALCVGGVDRWKNLYILDLSFGKWTFSQWCKEMYRLADKWHLKAVTVETVLFQKTLVYMIQQQFQRYRPLSIVEWKPPTRINKKERLETALEPAFTNQMIYMTRGLAHSEDLKDMVNFFPAESVNDDPIDAMAIVAEVAKPVVARPKTKQKTLVNRKYGGYR